MGADQEGQRGPLGVGVSGVTSGAHRGPCKHGTHTLGLLYWSALPPCKAQWPGAGGPQARLPRLRLGRGRPGGGKAGQQQVASGC